MSFIQNSNSFSISGNLPTLLLSEGVRETSMQDDTGAKRRFEAYSGKSTRFIFIYVEIETSSGHIFNKNNIDVEFIRASELLEGVLPILSCT